MGFLSRLRTHYAFVQGNFLLLTITWIFMNFAAPIPQTYASLYFKGLGADDFILSVIGFSGTIAIALVQFPGGYLADRHGRRWLVFTMTFGVAFSYIFFIIAPTWQFIVAGAMMQNFCLLYQPALFAIMLDSVAPENRGAGFTLQSVVTSLVSIPASLIAGFLILTFELDLGMRVAYSIVMVFFFAAAVLRVKLKETLPQNSGNTRPNFINALKEYPKAVREGLQVWKQVPKATFYLFIASAGMSSLLISCYIYFVVYAVEILKLQQFQWALVMAFTSMSIAVPTIIAGQRMDKTGRKGPLITGFLLYIPAMLIFLNANSTTIYAAFFFFGLGQTLHWTSYQSLIGDLTPRSLRGKVVGCSQFFMYMTQAITQLLVGALYAYVSPQLPFLLLAACAIPFSLLVYFRVFDPKMKEI